MIAYEEIRKYRVINLSLLTDCEHPHLGSGATPIGSAGAHPINQGLEEKEMKRKVVAWPESTHGLQASTPRLGGYSHREC